MARLTPDAVGVGRAARGSAQRVRSALSAAKIKELIDMSKSIKLSLKCTGYLRMGAVGEANWVPQCVWIFLVCHIRKRREIVDFIQKIDWKTAWLPLAPSDLLHQCNEKDFYSPKYLENALGSGAIRATFRIWRLA
jgi:hypothetical protein